LFISQTETATWLREHILLAYFLYFGAVVLLIGLSLLPTYACAALAGWVFGFKIGTVLAVSAVTIGSLLAYEIGIRIAAENVVSMIKERPKWRALHEALLARRAVHTLLVVMLVRIPPTSPFGLTNFLFAATKVPLWDYLVGTLIGIIPRTAAVCLIFSELQESLNVSLKPTWFVNTGSILMVLMVVILGILANRVLKRMTVNSGSA
jgi:uncharacterized membrane protein YdjX (TVP38/TMEM64 family)